MLVKISESVSVFEVYYERKQKNWINWMSTETPYKLEDVENMQVS